MCVLLPFYKNKIALSVFPMDALYGACFEIFLRSIGAARLHNWK